MTELSISKSARSYSDQAALTGDPFVSVIMPIRNEADFIERSLRAVLEQEYPVERMEVIIVDGQSDDGTRVVIDEVIAEAGTGDEPIPPVRILDNPRRIVPTALNIGIRAARGDVLVRVDGHCEIAPDFIRQDVALLAEHPEAWSVGGPIVHTATGPFGRAAALAMSHPLGIGNARHRFENYEGYGEGAAFPAFRRSVFERVGLFDERFVRNQDDEFNFRMLDAGGKVFISPRVRYVYFVRERASRLFKQYFQYGFWRIPFIRKHRRPFHIRQLIPSAFYLLLLLMTVVGFGLGEPIVSLALPTLYGGALLVAALAVVPSHGPAVAIRIPAAMLAMHAGYAFGFIYGLLANVVRPSAWEIDGRMSEISR